MVQSWLFDYKSQKIINLQNLIKYLPEYSLAEWDADGCSRVSISRSLVLRFLVWRKRNKVQTIAITATQSVDLKEKQCYFNERYLGAKRKHYMFFYLWTFTNMYIFYKSVSLFVKYYSKVLRNLCSVVFVKRIKKEIKSQQTSRTK